MRTDDGRWLLVNASQLDGGDAGDVAVVIQPAPAGSVLDGALRALGLSARERGGHIARAAGPLGEGDRGPWPWR
jgi:hypothetical protein